MDICKHSSDKLARKPVMVSQNVSYFLRVASISSAELELLFPITYEFVYAQGFVVSGFSARFLVLGWKDDRHSCNTSGHYTRQVCLASTLTTVKTSINSPGKNSGDIFLRLYSDLLLDSRQASKNGCKRPMYITSTASAHWNVYSQCFTELWKLMNVVFKNKKRNKCFLINTDESVPTTIFPRRPSFYSGRQSVHSLLNI